MRAATLLGTGTSQGVPVIGCDCRVCRSADPRDQRLRSSLHIQWDGVSLVVDAGPDFRQQMLREGFRRLDAILLTHEHNDHVAGMDDVRPLNFLHRKDMPVWGSPPVLQEIRTRFAYAFDSDPYPGAPRLDLRPLVAGSAFEVEGKRILPLRVDHGGLPVLGFRFGDLVYITDAKDLPPETREAITGVPFLILNALRLEPHYSHLHLDAAIQLARELKAGQTWFTHISHDLGLYKELSRQLPPGFRLGHDGLKIPF